MIKRDLSQFLTPEYFFFDKRIKQKEQGKIDALRGENFSIRGTASKIKRSIIVLHNYFKLKKKYVL